MSSGASSSATELELAHAAKDLDVSAAGRGVWLVKVPKYLSEQWKKCPNGKDVGRLKIARTKSANQKPNIVFSSYDMSQKAAAVATVVPSNIKTPLHIMAVAPKPVVARPGVRNHKFLVTNVGNQNLVVMSQAKTNEGGVDNSAEKVFIEGKVLQRAECHPIVDDSYRMLKKEQVQAQNTPVRQMKLLPGIVQTYKPVSDHYDNMEERKSKKTEAKRTRAEKDKVMDILFSAFEKHQFYNVKDLVGITKQPVPYLKEILKEICTYNMTAPHKNMWELKPEFRHYKAQDDDP